MQEYTAVIEQKENWWIGWIEEVPGVNCQEKSLEDLRESLKECLGELLISNKENALDAAGSDYREKIITL